MSEVIVNSDMILKTEGMVYGIIQDLGYIRAKLKKSFNEAGNGWSDEKYKQLYEIADDCLVKLLEPIDELFECTKKLQEIGKVIIEYEKIYF